MKYCSACGQDLARRVPSGDDRERFVCVVCETIHYQNPRLIVGCLPTWEGRILLCRRAIAPREGCWTLPAGFMENGESTRDGALRETREEALAVLGDAVLYTIFDLPHIDQVYMFYRGELVAPEFAPTSESSEVALFAEQDIPWGELAFPVVGATLQHYLVDRREGRFPVHNRVLSRADWAATMRPPG